MQPKLVVIMVTGCHLIPVISFAVSWRTSNMTTPPEGLVRPHHTLSHRARASVTR